MKGVWDNFKVNRRRVQGRVVLHKPSPSRSVRMLSRMECFRRNGQNAGKRVKKGGSSGYLEKRKSMKNKEE